MVVNMDTSSKKQIVELDKIDHMKKKIAQTLPDKMADCFSG